MVKISKEFESHFDWGKRHSKSSNSNPKEDLNSLGIDKELFTEFLKDWCKKNPLKKENTYGDSAGGRLPPANPQK